MGKILENDTLLGVLIAGGISILTLIVTKIFDLLQKRSERKTATEMQKRELYNIKRIEAVENYCKCLSKLDPGPIQHTPTRFEAFAESHARLSAFVTTDSLAIMESLMGTFHLSSGFGNVIHPDSHAYKLSHDLILQLNTEINASDEYKEQRLGKSKRRRSRTNIGSEE